MTYETPGVLPDRGMRFYLLKNLQTSFEVHPASYSVCIATSFTGVTAAGAWNSLQTCIWCRD